MAAKDVRQSPDGTWQVELTAFKINLFVYKAIGSTLVARRKERKKTWLFGPVKEVWVERQANRLSVTNEYFGVLPTLDPSSARRSCIANNSSSCDCRLWSAGVGISMDASADTGAPNPGTATPSSAASLDVRSVQATGWAIIGNFNISVGPVEAS